MKKRILLSVLALVLIITSVAVFVGCDSGTYKTTFLGTEFSIKLDMFGNADFGANIDELAKTAGVKIENTKKDDTKISYKVEKADEKGNKKVKFTYKTEDGTVVNLPIPATINKDGELVIIPLVLVLKK